MAKGDVTLKFDGQTAKFVQDIVHARDAMMAAADGTRKFGEHAESTGDKLFGLAVKMAGVASAEVLIEKGMEAASRAFENYMERMKQKADELLGKVLQLNTAVAGTGKQELGAGLRGQLEEVGHMKIGNMLVSGKEATQFASRAAGVQGTNEQQIMAATMAGLTGRAAGMSVEQAESVVQTRAFLSKQPGLANASQEELDNLAGYATQHIGELDDRKLRFISESGDPEEATRLLAAAAYSDEPTRAVQSLYDDVDKHLGKVSRLTIKDKKVMAGINRGLAALPQIGSFAAQATAPIDESTKAAFAFQNAQTVQERVNEIGALPALNMETRRVAFSASFQEQHPILSLMPGETGGQATRNEVFYRMAQYLAQIAEKVQGNPTLKNDHPGHD